MSKKDNPQKTLRPELLAPAGTIETFFTALEQGADAIYVGTPKFNARIRASNFSMDELSRMIAYAHEINRKVYIALNTLVKESELPELVDTLDTLRRISPDALIVQDLGVLRMARQLAPELHIHASTQMTIHNIEGALQAERMGLERVILARETTLEEISAIRKGTNIEIETFVHGAMCYSISGQCNFSSYVHGKSSNRGQCLQPCRRLFDIDEQRLPIFATMDLSAAPILFQLIAAGIGTFKIEGRLKPAETIGQVVAAYRLLIDAYPTITKEVVAEARDRIKLAIGRKQSTGFFLSPSPQDSMIGEGMSRSGRYLGKTIGAKGTSFDIRTREIIKVGDRLSFQKGRKKPPHGFKVKQLFSGNKPVRRSYPNQLTTVMTPVEIEKGSTIVKLIDADSLTKEATLHDDKKWQHARTRSKLTFEAELRMDWNAAVVLETKVKGNPISKETWPSYKENLTFEQAMSFLNEDNDLYQIRLEVKACTGFEDGVPMTKKELQSLRHEVLSLLAKTMDDNRDELLKTLTKPLSSDLKESKAKRHDFIMMDSLKTAYSLLKRPNTTVIVPLNEANEDSFSELMEDKSLIQSLFLELPTFTFEHGKSRDKMLSTLKHAVKAGIKRFVVSNLGHFNLLKSYQKHGLSIIADDALHCMNSACAEELFELGVTKAIFTQESDRMTLNALTKRTGKESIILQVYGKVPLFRTRHPKPDSGLHTTSVVGSRDDLQVIKRNGITYTIPGRDLSLRHLVPKLQSSGYKNFLYDLTYIKPSAKQIKFILQDKSELDPHEETSVNFEKELE